MPLNPTEIQQSHKTQLVETILTEVKDPAVREKLLAQLATGGEGKEESSSIVLRELDKLGIDTKAAKGLARLWLKAYVFAGYLVGGLFFVGGGLVAVANLLAANVATALFAGVFAALGFYALVFTRKLARLIKTA